MEPQHTNPVESMRVADLMRDYTTGDHLDWEYERACLDTLHGDYMARLTADIRINGVRTPVRLDHTAKAVMDGHHRILAAHAAGLEFIPVANAWDGTRWWVEQKIGTLSDDKRNGTGTGEGDPTP